MLLGLLMLYTATVTPYEVGFLILKLDTLFFVNRSVDLAFICNILVNFSLQYKIDHITGERVRLQQCINC